MFENLTDRLQSVFKTLRGHAKLTEGNIAEALREVRLALLEADVNFKVVKRFINQVQERAVGKEVFKSLTPGQQVIKIVHEELVDLLGREKAAMVRAPMPPTVVMLVGLQGSGKTTSCAKLAKTFKKEGRQPMLVAADIYRPAAIDQLKTLGTQIDVPVYAPGTDINPVEICESGLAAAKREGIDTVILDTAGRLHIDRALMDELRNIKSKTNPSEILLVADAMTGQDAVNIAQSFNNDLDISGVILTKLDGDARGGAALSIKSVTGKPIKLVGMGEKLDPLEVFHPDRMASRILGMGDVLSLIEKAESTLSEEQRKSMEKKLLESSFTLEDFKDQLVQLRKMGSFEQLLQMIPGMGKMVQMQGAVPTEKEFKQIEAMISSMTPEERRNHKIINTSRRRRIAGGSGSDIADVNRLLKQFDQARKMMKNIKTSRMFGKITQKQMPFFRR
ncbi:signal recognition particle protein [bacterium]|nr:signal recognition particle protein [candidate division CSSED10-310 bacterium]